MSCVSPVLAHRKVGGGVAFGKVGALFDQPLDIPCGECVGCRARAAKQWAQRCSHEAALHDVSWFVTLTYSDDWLPSDRSLEPDSLQRFLKRLRKAFPVCCARPGRDDPEEFYSGCGSKGSFRFFACGEYGSLTLRPHYHALFFGLPLTDLVPTQLRSSDEVLFRSATLDGVWGLGSCPIGRVTDRSASYVAGYANKKRGGEGGGARLEGRAAPPLTYFGRKRLLSSSLSHAEEGVSDVVEGAIEYERVDALTGELYQVEPEFRVMSRRPGIGARWISRYHREVYPFDEVVSRGKPSRPPRFYDDFLAREDPELLADVKARRLEKAASEKRPLVEEGRRLARKERALEAARDLRKRDKA